MGTFFYFLIQIYLLIILVYVLMSWIPNLRQSSFRHSLGKIVEPYLQVFRDVIPPIGRVDISVIVAYFALYLAALAVLTIF